jgi:hypothetical protein
MNKKWLLISYLAISGGFLASLSLAGLLGVQSGWGLLAVLGLGAFGGGFLAAYASPGETVKEPAIGAALFVLSLIGFFFLTPVGEFILRIMFAVSPGDTVMHITILTGVFFGGAFGGAYIGERAQGGRAQARAVVSIGLSGLTVLGGVFLAVFLLTMVLMSGKSFGGGADGVVGIMILAVFLGAIMGGIGARAGNATGGQAFVGALLAGAFLTLLFGGASSEAMMGGVVLSVVMLFGAFFGGLYGKNFADTVKG